MKKFVSVFLTLCMVMACMFTIVACNKNNNEANNSSSVEESSSSEAPNTSSTSTSSSIKSTDRPPHEWTPMPEQDYNFGTNTGEEETTVFLVGDSTVCYYDNEIAKYYPRNGYGMWFGEYLNDKVTVNNLALSGRSSRDFLTYKDGVNYQTLKNNIKEGDYLVIGFGHNDEKTGNLYTNPCSQVTDDDSFKYYLYTYYIKLALDAGATPILCTPIVRYSSSNNYTGTKIHVTTSTSAYEGGDYPKAIKELGQEFGITVIDLTTITKGIMETAGKDDARMYYASNAGDITTALNHNSIDETHTNAYGAATIAYNFMLEIAKTGNTLKNYINSEKMVAPTTDVLVPNLGTVA